MGRSFLKTWVITLLIIGGIIYPFLVIGTINYSGKDPRIDNVEPYYRKKEAIAESLTYASRMFIIGGSSAFYGIDTVLMEKKLNIPVVNYGMNAGLGLEYQLTRLLRILKDGDCVLLAFEGVMYATDSNQFNEYLHHYVFSYDQAYLLDIGFKRGIQKLYGTPWMDFVDSWKVWKQTARRRIPFLGQPKKTDWVLFVDQRGNRKQKDTWVRPMAEIVGRTELKPHAMALIRDFVHEAGKRNVKIFFTWPTTYRRADFLSKESKMKAQEMFQFLQAQGIAVIDDYADHLYPISFYTNTPYHLSQAGTRIRSERMADALRPYLGLKRQRQKTNGVFLLEERNHKIEYFKYDDSDRYDFKVYVNDNEFDNDLFLDYSGIERALREERPVYFSDEGLQPLLQKRFRIETAFCKQRSLEMDIDEYRNHIFLMTLNHVDEVPSFNRDLLPKAFSDAMRGKGYRIMVLGTGTYSDIHIVRRDDKRCQMTLKRRAPVGNMRLPFDLQMISTKKPLSRIDINQFAFFGQNLDTPGLWVLVYDPEVGIIVDEHIYSNPAPQPSACLFRVRNKS